ncbi:PREDICTED: uncharacterized protein LOC104603726 [Nelumbo nucifera]|uniref:Uncharacterized protein LOC104603726 n=1 Tax=Nelumbo nucifera TaxID=4432 RepID=A0A1U8AJK2_NELNU|nr:PREDICTED: uncharacterized protein LOC104603726 [Nelumbo nucifera]
MVPGFRRTLSFPNQHPSRPSRPQKSYHIRSTSLPCRAHPQISQLKDEINELKTWESKALSRNSAWLCDGLSRLRCIHDSLDDLLQLPQTQDSLRRQSHWVEKLLEDFLRFVDVYGIFRAALLALKEEHLAAQVAIRRRDESKIASYVKARKKMEKEMSKLVSVVRCIGKSMVPGAVSVSDGDAELAAVLKDVNDVTVSVSILLFNGILSSSSPSSSSSLSSKSWMLWRPSKKTKKIEAEEGIRELEEVRVESLCRLKKQGEEEVRMTLRRMQALEDCIGGIESESERVFRSFINTRVSLLNILTQ